MAFDHFNTTPPADIIPQVENNSQATPPIEVATPASGTPPTETAPIVETKPDEFIDSFNKRFNAQFKGEEEVKELFSLKGKLGEYETKYKDYDELKGSVDKYKKELEEVKERGISDLLDKPRIRKAYVAEQLIGRYPDRDPDILGEIAMSDIDRMSDIDAIAKERMITVKGLTFEEARLAKMADFGIDLETKPEEWDSVAKARVKIAGAEAKERIKQLLSGVEIPKTVTKEERQALQARTLEDKVKAAQPIRDIFNKFDTYKNGDFEFAPPDEFKSKLDGIFKGMFIDGGLEVNEQNIATAELIKKALFTEEYLPQMLEVKAKAIRAEMQEKFDKETHNDTPPNTATATDQQSAADPNKQGISNFFRSK